MNVLICVSCGQQAIPSVKRECSGCGSEIALTLDAVSMAEREQMQPVCVPCALAVIDKEPNYQFGGVVVGKEIVHPDTPSRTLRQKIALHNNRN